MHRIVIDPLCCKGCRLCIDQCPQNVLAVSGSRNARGYPVAEASHPEDCSGCLTCELICPDMAIAVEGVPDES